MEVEVEGIGPPSGSPEPGTTFASPVIAAAGVGVSQVELTFQGEGSSQVSAPMLKHTVRVAGGVPLDDLDRNGFGAFLDASGELEVKYLLGRIEQPPTGDIDTRN